jgi:ABC-2 type transport system ATP-binding protein
MISISNLSKHYGGVVAVDDLNLSIEPGEAFGFIGPNEAGNPHDSHLFLSTFAWAE